MPLIDEQIDALSGHEVFSVIDLKNGFFHVPMATESVKYTSFVTPQGQYEFLRTPFGLSVSPTSFLRFVHKVFRELVTKGVVVTYMDDVIIPAKDYEEALTKLSQVLEVAAENGLNMNWKKCKFLQEEVEFLGHIVTKGRIKRHPIK